METLSSEFEQLLKVLADDELHVVIGGFAIKCKKSVLAKKCGYFEALFEFHNSSDKIDGVFHLHIPETANFQDEDVKFILDRKTAKYSVAKNAVSLLYASAFLQCKETEAISVKILHSNLKIQNAFATFSIAHEVASKDLEDKVEKFIIKEYSTWTFKPKSIFDILTLDNEEFGNSIYLKLGIISSFFTL